MKPKKSGFNLKFWFGTGKDEQEETDELTRMIGYLTKATTWTDDWVLVQKVSQLSSVDDSHAKAAIYTLRKELKHGRPSAQLAAARLWAILILRNRAEIIVSHSATKKFLDTIQALVTSPETQPVVRERLMDILSAASYEMGNDRQQSGFKFRELWIKVKPVEKPDEGVPFDADDPIFPPDVMQSTESSQSNTSKPTSSASNIYNHSPSLPDQTERPAFPTYPTEEEHRPVILASLRSGLDTNMVRTISEGSSNTSYLSSTRTISLFSRTSFDSGMDTEDSDFFSVERKISGSPNNCLDGILETANAQHTEQSLDQEDHGTPQSDGNEFDVNIRSLKRRREKSVISPENRSEFPLDDADEILSGWTSEELAPSWMSQLEHSEVSTFWTRPGTWTPDRLYEMKVFTGTAPTEAIFSRSGGKPIVVDGIPRRTNQLINLYFACHLRDYREVGNVDDKFSHVEDTVARVMNMMEVGRSEKIMD
ncbi:hypothetical protein C8J56DRAFT_54712 [Mycena floridula]|nr:hypothetical protein C8J56DRAFT_54712 [Mycena floridula]